MNKKLLLLPLIASCLLGSCGNKKPSEIMINDFESIQQLTLMKFPFPSHQNRGRMDLSTEHVTSGERSLKYFNDHGSSIEMAHYFTHTVGGKINISDIKSIEVDIYNDSEFDTSCTFTIYATKEMNSLLTQTYELKKGVSTHISFPLSKIALEYNANNIICSSLTLLTPNTDYNKGIGYTFYIDSWKAKMGAELTEQDKLYKPVMEEIRTKIDALPAAGSLMLTDDEKLHEIALLITELPDLYRRVIPNIEKYKETVEEYYDIYNASTKIDYDRNTFLAFDKFFGITQFDIDPITNASVSYTEKSWSGNEGRGSTEILFAGSLYNKFNYKSEVDLNDFDFIHIKAHNASNNHIRIWVSYTNGLFLDVPAGRTSEGSFAATSLTTQYFWEIVHLRSATNGAVIPASGALYFSEVYVTGRSQTTLQDHIQHAFAQLPSVEDLTNEESILNSMTAIKTAVELYSSIEDKSTITQEQLTNLYALEAKVDELGYGLCYNAFDNPMKRFSTYGQDFGASLMKDPTNRFGFVSAAHISVPPVHPDDPNRHEQSFTFAGKTLVKESYKGYVMYMYNPTEHDISYRVISYVSQNDWGWGEIESLFTSGTAKPGWNKIEVKKELIMACDDRVFAVNIDDASQNLDVTGDWLFSSLFGIPRSI